MNALALFGRGRPAGWATVAGLTILAGYTNLWFGGTDIASVVLVIGYLMLVPIAFMSRSDVVPLASVQRNVRSERHADSVLVSPPYGIAAIVALAIFALYAATLAPTTAMWDTSEYIASARVLGIPHPPGNPVFVLIAHAFGLLPIPVSYAARVNLLAACTSALSAGCWFLVADRAMQPWMQSTRARHIAAAAAAWIGATAFTVWNQSVVNEKVYTVALLGVAAVSWIGIRWRDERDSSRADRLLLLALYLCGIGYANHPAGLLPLPALAILILSHKPKTFLRWRFAIAAAASLALGLTPFAFQPIRSANKPAINGGAPTACKSGPQLGCTFSAETLSRLMANINREQYGGHPVVERQAAFGAQMQMWWMYFKRQWLRDAYDNQVQLQRALAVLFLALGVGGAVVHWHRDRTTFWYVAPLIVTLNVVLVFYLNFRLAPLQDPELGNSVAREVRDRDYFYIWGFSTWGIWAGIALAALWQWLSRMGERALSSARDARPDTSDALSSTRRILSAGRRETLSWIIAAPILAIALVPFVGNRTQAPRNGQTFTREWAVDLLNSIEPYGILITYGDNDSFPLWYAQEVEGVRRDVTLALAPYLGSDWYVRELLTRKPDSFKPSDGFSVYRSQQWVEPTSPPLNLTVHEADEIPPVIRLDAPQRFVHGDISAVIPAGYLGRDQLIVLQLIKDAFPSRPIYFSVAYYPRALGLGPYLLQQGLAQRLMPSRVTATDTIVEYPGGHVDLTRTLALWKSYRAPQALIRQNGWIDEPSNGIPGMYIGTAELLAAALSARGNTASVEELLNTANAMAASAHLAN